MNTKIDAAAAVLEAMGGAAIEPKANEAEAANAVAKVKKVVKAIKKAAKAVKKVKKAKAPETPKRPGPKTLPVAFPANTTHTTAAGGTLTVVKVRVSYLVQLNGGRLKWFGAKKMAAAVPTGAPAPAEAPAEAAA